MINKHLTYEEWFNEYKDYKDAYKNYVKLQSENDELQYENIQLKKQKDDVVEYIKKKKEKLHHSFDEPDWDYLFICNPDELLRMLGETNEFE